MGRDDEPLGGFLWRGGAERETNGILMWSKPFIVTQPFTGEEVSVYMTLSMLLYCSTVLIVDGCVAHGHTGCI